MCSNLEELNKFCQKSIESYPDLKDEIMDLYELAVTEVEDGESEREECYLAQSNINQIIENFKEINNDT